MTVVAALEQRYRLILDGLTDAAVVVDNDWRPLLWNAAYQRLVGVRPKAFARLMEGQPRCHELFRLEACGESCVAARAFGTGRAARMDELRGRAMLGASSGETPEEVTLIVSATPLRDDDGAIIAVLEVYRDVTAEARIQDRYKALLEGERRRAELLEEQVRERTAKLRGSLEALQEARARLVQSEKLSSLGQLVAGIAHELNNPINFIYGNAGFLGEYTDKLRQLIAFYDELTLSMADQARLQRKKAELDIDYVLQDTESLLRAIRSGAERATAIIRELRSFMRGGAQPVAPLQLAECLEATLNQVRRQADERGVRLRSDCRDLDARVHGNAGQLGQVFMNLLVNALQAVRDGGEISVLHTRRDDGVVVEVADDGAGISEANILKVFDPFFTTKPVGTGMGLGLTLSYSIINAHGGRLSVKSELGRGATFTVWLPQA